ncbi:hypothetical protein FQN50_000285 [Emmonsiellopsis sp. PD_5]|nr:hypothetical protein FQN50_000285 [Emmonsiellopsis sp. PD_5]
MPSKSWKKLAKDKKEEMISILLHSDIELNKENQKISKCLRRRRWAWNGGLCKKHRYLDADLIRDQYDLLHEAVNARLDKYMCRRSELTEGQRKIVEYLHRINDMWLRLPGIDTESKGWAYQANDCKACMLARVGKNPTALKYLRTVLLGELDLPAKPTRNKDDAFLSWVELCLEVHQRGSSDSGIVTSRTTHAKREKHDVTRSQSQRHEKREWQSKNPSRHTSVYCNAIVEDYLPSDSESPSMGEGDLDFTYHQFSYGQAPRSHRDNQLHHEGSGDNAILTTADEHQHPNHSSHIPHSRRSSSRYFSGIERFRRQSTASFSSIYSTQPTPMHSRRTSMSSGRFCPATPTTTISESVSTYSVRNHDYFDREKTSEKLADEYRGRLCHSPSEYDYNGDDDDDDGWEDASVSDEASMGHAVLAGDDHTRHSGKWSEGIPMLSPRRPAIDDYGETFSPHADEVAASLQRLAINTSTSPDLNSWHRSGAAAASGGDDGYYGDYYDNTTAARPGGLDSHLQRRGGVEVDPISPRQSGRSRRVTRWSSLWV